MLISFLIPSRNTFFLKRFLNSLEKNTLAKNQIEVLIKLDEDQDYTNFINETKKNYSYSIKYLISPRLEGQPSLWFAVEQLYQLSNTDSYFVQILSDEPYIDTMNWDQNLLKYKNLFKDGVFRLRTSNLKYFNYSNEFDCVTKPDSYPIYTRKWLDLTIGTGECWGSDAYQQLIAYYLSLGPLNYFNFQNRSGALSRDIPITDIKYNGLEWGVGVEGEKLKYIRKYMIHEWKRLISKSNLENISYKAMRIFLYIYAKSLKLNKFQIIRNGNCVVLIDKSDDFNVLTLTYKIFPKFLSNNQKLMLGYFDIYQKIILVISSFFMFISSFFKSSFFKPSFSKPSFFYSIFYSMRNFFNLMLDFIKKIIKKFLVKINVFTQIKKLKEKILKKLNNIFDSIKLNNIFDSILFLIKKDEKKKWIERNQMSCNPFPTSPKIDIINTTSKIFYKKNFELTYNPPGFQFLNFPRNIKIPTEIGIISHKQIEYTKEQINKLQIFKKKLEEKTYE